MAHDSSLNGMIAFGVVSAIVWAIGFFVFLRIYGDKRRALARLRDISPPAAADHLQGLPEAWALKKLPVFRSLFLPKEQTQVERIRPLLTQAGIFNVHGPHLFIGVKWLLMLLLPVITGLVPFLVGWLPLQRLSLFALCGCAAGMWLPNWWLRSRVAKRQQLLRSGVADMLDMLVLCLEGGVGLTSAIQQVTDELHIVHPVLGVEMNILYREIQLGLSPGEALKKLAQRCGLQEIRDLAATILQSEHYGASIAKALRNYADANRQDRQLRAEEMAQKAAVKIVFPTLLFIFPAIFVVILGPAAFQLAKMFTKQ